MLAKILLVHFFIRVAYGRVLEGDICFFFSSPSVRMQEFNISNIRDLGLNNTTEIKIIAHGWLDDKDTPWYEPTINNYLAKRDAYVIALDWPKYAFGFYGVAVENAPDIGRLTAVMILEMADAYNISLSKFHLVGHSLGAHLVGYTGQHIYAATGKKVGRITGLDPAGPLFEGTEPNGRLSSDDAIFVDIIHTDSGGLGYNGSLGDVDYYPNGGIASQKGCAVLLFSCSHNRAPSLFYESILSQGFIAVSCDNIDDFRIGKCNDNQKIVMGENVNEIARGDYYLNTARSPPFALGTL